MARDPIKSLLRLRRMTLDEARVAIADCLSREARAEQALVEADAAILRETEAARASTGDAEVEAFANWLPVGRRTMHNAEAGRDSAAREVALARAALTLARAAAEATETLLDRRAMAQREEAEKRAQAVLDEVGLRSRQD